MPSVPFYKHNLGDEEIDGISETLRGVFLTTGPKTRAFEEAFSDYLNVSHSVGVTSWTTGAFLVLKAWGIKDDDEVLVPAMTFIATANIVLQCGATPVFVDSDPVTGNMDIESLEAKITARTRAVIPVHLYGQMADMKAIREIADRHGLRVLEDSAHCIEGQRDGYGPGQLGDAACFSFYATKNISCGEGGAISTNDSRLAEQLRLLRLHGMNKSAADRYTKSYQHWDMEILGYKANMFDLQAALLLPQLARIDETLKRKQSICKTYESAFLDAGIEFPRELPGSVSARHLFTIWAPTGRRDEMLGELQSNGVGVAVNFRSVTSLKFYRERFGFQHGDHPNAETIGERTITIPMYPQLTDLEISYVIDSVIAAYRNVNRKAA